MKQDNQDWIESSQNYNRIAEAIGYIHQNFKKQPGLDEIAEVAGMSRFHFQRVFSDWVGVSPKKFVQYLSVEYAKGLLQDRKRSLLNVSYAAGLSGPSRLHDLFVRIESMTPGEFKNGGEALEIKYRFSESPFGRLVVATTRLGVCYMGFGENNDALESLQDQFPNASFIQSEDRFQDDALRVFQGDWGAVDSVKLHLKGTAFQLKVWQCLLKIPTGGLATYNDIARSIGQPAANRAVGSAIGKNPVAYLIPCHRVIQASGQLGSYRWGGGRKSAMVGWEAVVANKG